MADIVVLDDNPDILKPILKRLTAVGHSARGFSDSKTGWGAIQSAPPDLIVLDRKMPELSGDLIREKMMENSELSEIPVIFLTGQSQRSEKIQGLRMGVDDYITKPFDMEEFLARVNNIISRRQSYKRSAQEDGLTGCMNRAAFDQAFRKLFKSTERYGGVFSILVVDVDELKRVNDLLGHPMGDKVIVKIAELLKKCLRESDFIARYGGDEFVILLPGTTEEGAKQFAERIRAQVASFPPERGPGGEVLKVGVSAGAAAYQPEIQTPEELFSLADRRMYQSKFQSRRDQKIKKTILVVEDKVDIRKAVLFRIQQAGFETLTAEDGESALRIARAMRPDLILLDLMLPKLPGEDVCKAIREDDDPYFSKTPIIMMSAKSSEADQIVGRVIGANLYMTKPFNMDELIKNLMKFIRN